MNELQTIVETVINQQKAVLSPSTFDARKNYLYHLVELGESIGITKPCQELYNSYAARAKTKDLHFFIHHTIRLVDREADTRAYTPKGILYNEPELPTVEESDAVFRNLSFPINNEDVDVGHLIIRASKEMEYLCLTESTTGQYKKAWRELFCFMYTNDSTIFSKEAVDAFLKKSFNNLQNGNLREWKWKIHRRSICILLEVASKGKFEWKMFRSKKVGCSNDLIEELRCQYTAYLKTMNLENKTIMLHDYTFRTIIEEGGFQDLDDLANLSTEQVQDMLKGLSKRLCINSRGTIYPIVRQIMAYFYKNGYIPNDCSGMVLTPAYKHMHLRPYVSSSDEDKIFNVLDNSPLRNRAMMRLALRLGLRDTDICNLRFSQIDWNTDRITIEQEKTGVSLTLPLLEDVGNAIMDYIIDERPTMDKAYPYVFVRMQAPYTKLSSMYMVCSKIFDSADVSTVNKKSRGVHVCRYTLIHKLLKAKVPHQVITDALGHTSKESDKPYISMEESMLRECPLDFSLIGQKYWKEGAANG